MTLIRLIPALDTLSLDDALSCVRDTHACNSVYGYKVGFSLGLRHGLHAFMEKCRTITNKPFIYDHQKAATDIPETGPLFAQTLRECGITEGILFPQAGARTLAAWTKALRENNLKVIVGGMMTHEGYVLSEGGYLDDNAITRIYSDAWNLGVRSFVTPLTRPDFVNSLINSIPGMANAEFYSPGYGAQGGSRNGYPNIAKHYVIVGRRLLAASDKKGEIEKMETELGIL
jgi:orotidine-5'-phosphate decarboxylase